MSKKIGFRSYENAKDEEKQNDRNCNQKKS